MTEITVALDWTPNIIHAGFFIAKQLKWFEEEGLKVHLLSPKEDNYSTTPLRKLLDPKRKVDFALSPTESVMSYQTSRNPQDVVAVSALLQKDASAIVTLSTSGIDKPSKLDGKIYGSYAARFEDHIVKEMVKNDGGSGELKITQPNKLKIWDNFLSGTVDSTWVFMPWEGARAEQQSVKLNVFKMQDYKIPYSYSPLLITTRAQLKAKGDTYKKFIAVVAKGYKLLANDPPKAIEALKNCGEEDLKDSKLLERACAHLKGTILLDNGTWGTMDANRWKAFVDWLVEKGLLEKDKKPDIGRLYTNDLLA